MTTVGVTGAHGFLGEAFCEALSAKGHQVIPYVRTPSSDLERSFNLTNPKASDFTGVQLLIHCAWDLSVSFTHDILAINVQGSRELFSAANTAGVQCIIFISSMAAFQGCRSLYGRSKLQVEEIIISTGDIVIRPGTVYGGKEGGIVKAITKVMKKLRIAPLIGGGKHTLYTVHIDDLCALVSQVVERYESLRGRCIVAAHSAPVTLRSFFESLAARANCKPMFIPLPTPFVYYPLKFLELIGIKPPLRSDSVVSITQGAGKEVPSLPQEITVKFRAL